MSDSFKPISPFLEAAKVDKRIKPAHMSLYIALFFEWLLHGQRIPFFISRSKIIQSVCFTSIATYHKTMKELAEFKYIHYEPSYDPRIGTKVYLYKQKEALD